MKKVLLVREKHSDRVFDISTPELSEKAYLQLFKERNKDSYYSDLIQMRSILYSEAKNGNEKAAKCIIMFRAHQGYEYEYIEEIDVEEEGRVGRWKK